MKTYRFFDSASTTKCCEAALEVLQQYAAEDFGNPSSTHALGLRAARAIRDAREFFAQKFRVEPEQVIFTSSGSEANNLAIYGVTTALLFQKSRSTPIRVLTSSIEHPSVKKTVESLHALGVETRFFPVSASGIINQDQLLEDLTPHSKLLSIQQINNITGTVIPVEEIARIAKTTIPKLIVHCDAIQSFGKIQTPTHPSSIDLVSISAHKIEGPKGVGALIVLNKKLLQGGIRPLVWGGEQEFGLRSGTQNAGLIAGFHQAAKIALENRQSCLERIQSLRHRLKEGLQAKSLWNPDPEKTGEYPIRWNSPENASPFIINLSVPGIPSGPLAKMLEDRGCLISLGSACSARKPEPDPVLQAMGFSMDIQTSALRVSLGNQLSVEDIDYFVQTLAESIQVASQLLGYTLKKKRNLRGKS
jgi:cysteine desulfurase